MGEIADMMLGGEMCAMCGEWLEGEGWGIPGYCSEECAREAGADLSQVVGGSEHFPEDEDLRDCPRCNRKGLKGYQGLNDHMRVKHLGAEDV